MTGRNPGGPSDFKLTVNADHDCPQTRRIPPPAQTRIGELLNASVNNMGLISGTG